MGLNLETVEPTAIVQEVSGDLPGAGGQQERHAGDRREPEDARRSKSTRRCCARRWRTWSTMPSSTRSRRARDGASPAGDGPADQFIVEDTGVGVAPTDQPRLFEKFYRARRSRDPAREGLGPRAGDRQVDRRAARRPGDRWRAGSGQGASSRWRSRWRAGWRDPPLTEDVPDVKLLPTCRTGNRTGAERGA